MKIKEIVNALEIFAPLPLQDGFDNAGLQIGLTDAEATGALLCLDVTEAVVDEAVTLGYNLIVSHHPLIFKGYKSITGKDYVERCIMKAIKNDISIFSMHTNLDNAPQGVNYKIAEKIGLQNIRILDPKENALLKLVTFVPAKMAGIVRQALFEAGCGCIGNYDACSYNVEGEGTFRAQEGTHPYCGKIGELHKEPETRIETILPAYLRSAVTKALLAVHPYEEPAYDFYPLANTWNQVGSGIIGELKEVKTTMQTNNEGTEAVRQFLQVVREQTTKQLPAPELIAHAAEEKAKAEAKSEEQEREIARLRSENSALQEYKEKAHQELCRVRDEQKTIGKIKVNTEL